MKLLIPNDIHRYKFNGKQVLEYIIRNSEYGSLEQAVASLALFSHPKTVEQTKNNNLFLIVRDFKKRGKIENGVMLDDNSGPKNAFNWANSFLYNRDWHLQYCHVRTDSKNVKTYTNLANIIAVPVFLSKLTDADLKVQSCLRYRVYDIYGYCPEKKQPQKPKDYDSLEWAPYLSPNDNVELSILREMSTKPKNRTTQSAKELGWLFSNYQPDIRLTGGGQSAIGSFIQPKGPKDNTKYIFKGQIYPKNGLVLAVVKDYLLIHPNTTFNELKQTFPDQLQGTKYGVLTDKEKALRIYNETGYKRYFINNDDILMTIDKREIAICTQWGFPKITRFINAAKALGYDIKESK